MYLVDLLFIGVIIIPIAFFIGYFSYIIDHSSRPKTNDNEFYSELEKAADEYVTKWYGEKHLDKDDYPIDVKATKADFKAGAIWGNKRAKRDYQ